MRIIKRKHFREIQFILLLLLLFSFGFQADAQQLISRDAADYNPGTDVSKTGIGVSCGNDTIILGSIDPTAGRDFTFSLGGGTLTEEVTNVTITIKSGSCTHSTITITPDQSGTPTSPNRTISFPMNPDPSIEDCDIIFEVQAFKQGAFPNPDKNDCVTFVARYTSQDIPIKIAFVLDISGSMGLPVYSTGTTPPDRIDVLKNSVYSFLRKLEQFSGTGSDDKIGLTYFTTTVIDASNTDLLNGIVPAATSYDPVYADLSVQTPQSLTAMGLGLEKGKQILGGNTESGFKKVVILITDGLQNVTPLASTIEYSPGIYATFLGPQADNKRLNDLSASSSADSIYYFCIAMDVTGGDVPALLSEIAQYNGGDAFKTSNSDLPVDNGDGTYDIPNVELDGSLDQILDKIYNNSPQVVKIYKSKLEQGTKSLTFDVNDNISKLLFELNYPFGESIDIVSIKRNGVDIDFLNSFESSSSPEGNFKIYSLGFPYKEGQSEISPKGQWTVTVSGSQDIGFKLKCFVDDHEFDYSCSAGKQFYTVGDTIKFTGQLTLNNEVLKNPDNKIKLILLKPGDDIGHLLATYETPDIQVDSVGDISPVALKMNALLKDENFVKALAEENQIFELTQDEDGIFTGEFSDTELSGTYQAYFLIEAENKLYGKFNRLVIRSIYMRFGMIDPEETQFDINTSQGDNGQTFVITVKPKNKFGYYLGPGFSSFITLDIDTIKGVKSEVKDNLDGSYTYTITNIPENISPNSVSFTLFGETFGGEDDCYPVTIWYYIILLVILLIVILIRNIKAKWFKILMWLILVIWVVYIVLRYLHIICYEFL